MILLSPAILYIKTQCSLSIYDQFWHSHYLISTRRFLASYEARCLKFGRHATIRASRTIISRKRETVLQSTVILATVIRLWGMGIFYTY